MPYYLRLVVPYYVKVPILGLLHCIVEMVMQMPFAINHLVAANADELVNTSRNLLQDRATSPNNIHMALGPPNTCASLLYDECMRALGELH